MCSYESIKSSIRLLLTSSSNGLSLEQLNSDYKYYNQSENIPYQNFGYSTLFNFLSDMPDVVQFNLNSSPPIVFSVKNNNISSKSNRKFQISTLKDKNLSLEKINKRSTKNVKRIVLKELSNNNVSTENIINQLTNLTMNQKSSMNKLSENEIFTIPINLTNQCQVVRCANGKYYVPCFELSRILNLNENIIDKETMFSRMRIYESNYLFNQFKFMNNSCQHTKECRRPYFFLILISSIIPVLQMTKYISQYYQILFAFQQLFIM